MKNKKNIKKNHLSFWTVPISAAFLIFVLGFAYQAIAQQVGLTIGYVESGSADLNMTASTQNLFYGLVDVNSTVNDAGFLLLEKGAGNQMFKVDISGRIKSAANMALGGAALSGSHVLNATGSINTTGGFCINDDCKTNWSSIAGTNYWIQSGLNLYASNTDWNIGIGTTNASQKLSVAGNIEASGYVRGVTIGVVVDTAAATTAKTATVNDYTLTAGDLLAVKFTNGNTVSYPTLNINGTGAKNIRIGTTNVNTTTFYFGAGATTLLYYDGSYFQVMGSQRTSDSTVDANMYFNINKLMGATLYDYKIIAEGDDGRYYPLTLEEGTGTSKTITTRPLKIGGNIMYYNGTANVAENSLVTNTYTEINFANMHYTFNQSGGYTNYKPIYLVGTVDSNGYFVLDNSSATSFYTQTLPTTENGKLYMYLGQVYSTNHMRLTLKHPIYEYRDGRVQLYSSDKYWSSSDSNVWNINNKIGIGTTVPATKLHVSDGTVSVINVGGGYIENLALTPTESDQATSKYYVDNTVQSYALPSGNGDFGYWNLNNSVISNRNSISASVGVNTGGTSISGVSFAVAQGQAGSGTARVDSGELNKVKGCTGTNFYNTFKEGDLFKPNGLATTTVTWVSSTTEEMLVDPPYSAPFSCLTYNVASVPVGGTPIFVVKGSGQVGIGTVAPAASLHISSAGTNELSDKAIIVGDASSSIAFAVSRLGRVTIGSSTAEEMLNIGDGKIFLASTASSSPVDNRLYNVDGNLYWGSTVIGSPSSSLWNLLGDTVSASSSSWKIAIGSSTPASEALHLSGRLFLGDTEAPAETDNRLYSMLGKLYWDGAPVGADATTTWALSGSNLFASSSDWNVAIGTSDAAGYKLNVDGNSNFNSNIRVLGNVYSGKIYNTAGSAASSSYSFALDTDTGMYNSNTNNISFSTGGLERLRINQYGRVGIGTTDPGNSQLYVWGGTTLDGVVSVTNVIENSAGSNTAPSYSFAGDLNTGIYHPTSDQVALTTNGVARLTVSATQFTGTLPWRGQNGSASYPAFSFSTDNNTGMFNAAADSLAFATAGNERIRIISNGNVGIGTTNPGTYKLNVNGTSYFGGTTTLNSTLYLKAGSSIVFSDRGNGGFYMSDNTWIRTPNYIKASGYVVGDGNSLNAGYSADFNNLKISGVATSTVYSDVATVGYVDSLVGSAAFLPLTGGILSGSVEFVGPNIPLVMNGNDIENVDKLYVNTIDPIYNIDGKAYATYAASFAGGVKEEFSGQAYLKKSLINGEFEAVLDFDKLEVGSDLWLWRQTLDFSEENVEVIITPYGNLARTYYLIEDNKIILRADKETKVSYRLIGRRFDWRKHPTLSEDQTRAGLFVR